MFRHRMLLGDWLLAARHSTSTRAVECRAHIRGHRSDVSPLSAPAARRMPKRRSPLWPDARTVSFTIARGASRQFYIVRPALRTPVGAIGPPDATFLKNIRCSRSEDRNAEGDLHA